MSKQFEKIKSFIDHLKGIDYIDLENEKTNDEFLELSERASRRLKNTVLDYSSIKIDDQDNYIGNISGVSCCWSYTDEENNFIYGGFDFNGMTEALAQESDFYQTINSIINHNPNEKEMEFLKKLNWFEKQAWGDDGKFGCFLREPGDFPPKIYYYDYGLVFPMSISWKEYLDAMISSCAVRGWHYFYIDFPEDFPENQKVNKKIVIEDMTFIVTMLNKLFPDMDFSYHEKRLEVIK